MNRTNQNPLFENFNPGCADMVTMAEQELSAFFRAVTELFGPKQAKLSADDWLQELTATDHLPASLRDLRRITATASTRLAGRVEAKLLLTTVCAPAH